MAGGWVVEGGDYRIDVGHSSRDIDASVTVTVVGDSAAQPLSLDSTLSELLAVPAGRAAILGQMRKSLGLTEIDPALEQLIGSIPLRRVVPMMGIDPAELEALLARG
jgi:beta-glucosidase